MKIKTAIEIFLLGQFRIVTNGQLIPRSAWRRRKARLLVAILSLEKTQQMNREQLTEMLFPDAAQSTANANFYRLVYEARRTLEPDLAPEQKPAFLVYEGKQIRLTADLPAWVDAVEFEQTAQLGLRRKDTAALERSTELYSDDLLTDEPHEEWAHERRERLRSLYHSVLRRLADQTERSGDIDAAHYWLDRALQCEPADESAHRAKMRLYHMEGERSLALRQYEHCVKVLDRELSVEPERETELLRQEILRLRETDR